MSKKTENEGVLEGMRCPKCKSLEPFKIEVKTILMVHDDGTEDAGADNEWDESSYCECCKCVQTGTVYDFQVKNQKRKRGAK